MSKVRTESDFFDIIDADFSWRMLEIVNMKSAITASSSVAQRTLVRASIPIFYAQWEGFVKNGSQKVLDFLNTRRPLLKDLSAPFLTHGAKKILQKLESGIIIDQISAIEELINISNQTAVFMSKTSIETGSNLNSDRFSKIAISLGIDTGRYHTKYTFIDKSLLDKRNNIAHGQYLDIDANTALSIADEVISLLRNYKDDLQNLITLQAYKKQQTT